MGRESITDEYNHLFESRILAMEETAIAEEKQNRRRRALHEYTTMAA